MRRKKKKSFGASKLKANTKHKRKKKLIINMQICASQPYSKTMFHAKKKKKNHGIVLYTSDSMYDQ